MLNALRLSAQRDRAKKLRRRIEMRAAKRAAGQVGSNGKEQSMTQVGIIADTHGRLPRAAYEALAGCDAIIHAGDIGGPRILAELETLAPVYAVLGNNDFDEYGSSVGRFARPRIAGVQFLVAHYPRDVRLRRTGALGAAGFPSGSVVPDICVHGHTHVPDIVCGSAARPAAYVICPGSASDPRGGKPASIALVDIADGSVEDARIVPIYEKARG